MKHLTIGGSTISRTINCPSWFKNVNRNSEKPASQAANLGNLLHDCMENHYQKGLSFEEQIGKVKFEDLTLTEEHLPILNKMRYQVETILDKYNIAELICEPFVEYLKGEAGGSIDLLGVSEDGKTVIILDYKTGRVAVQASENAQLLFYTLCAKTDTKTQAMFKNASKFIGVIVQPYVYDDPDEYEFDTKKLGYFRIEVDTAIQLTEQPNPPTVAGTHCAFCPKTAICTTRREYAESAFLMPSKDRKSLSQSLQLAIDLKSWCEEVIETAHHVASEGIKIPGYKQVEGRKTRIWEDEKEAVKQLEADLKDKAYNKKLLSPTQAIKALKAKGVEAEKYNSFIDFKQAKPLIVKDSDKREAITTNFLNKNLHKFLANKPTK